PVRDLDSDREGVRLRTDRGTVRAGHVALGTNVFPALLRRYRLHTVPVYDYVLVSEPLTPRQRAAIGWSERMGIDDLANQFHYYRQTSDHRILFGGYDAVYHYGRHLRAAYDSRRSTFETLAAHFAQTFPQLGDVGFSHAWGGAIDTCTRFFPFFGTGHGGRVAHTAGFTGLGVGATRFAAQVLLDLLEVDTAGPTELTELQMVRKRPLPFPPEPAAWLGITATRASLAAADRHEGRRNPWLRTLDAVGVGFDS
ncbi:MAG: NAD(P)/FAD-dependent oxidoreductase, partial [Janthinobacterium lividum]